MGSNCAIPGTSQMGALCGMGYYIQPDQMAAYKADQLHQSQAIFISLIFLSIIACIIIFIMIIIWRFKFWEIKYSFKNRLELVRSVTDPDYHEDRSKTFVRMAGLYDPFVGALTSAQSERENKREVQATGKAVKNNTVPYEEALEVANRHGSLNLIHQLFNNDVTNKEIAKILSGRVSEAQISALRDHYDNRE